MSPFDVELDYEDVYDDEDDQNEFEENPDDALER